MSIFSVVRRNLRRNPTTAAFVDRVRPLYRRLRTRWLRLRYPHGGFVSGNGVRVFVDFSDPNYAWYYADAPNLAFDRRVIAALLQQSEGNVFADIGAHCGFYAAALAQALATLTPRAKLIALEPDPGSFACLERTVAPFRGHVDATLLRMAAGEFDGEVDLYRGPDAACAHTFAAASSQAFGRAPIRRLDTLTRDLLSAGDRLAFMKVDIDGAEPAFLRGARETIARHQPLIFIEFSPIVIRAAGESPKAFFEELTSSFHVQWVAYQTESVRPVVRSDFEQIEAAISDGVTDLVLSSRPIELDVR